MKYSKRMKNLLKNSWCQLKWSFLILSWIFAGIVILWHCVDHANRKNAGDVESRLFWEQLPKNQINELSFLLRDPANGGRPVLSMSFSRLQPENGELGMFKTGLYKTIEIQDLEIGTYQYPGPESPDGNALLSKTTVCDPGASGFNWDIVAYFRDVAEKLPETLNKYGAIDMTNAMGVDVKEFKYTIFSDQKPALEICSKRASISYNESQIRLRGHVKISTPDGKSLESNSILWDVSKQQFTARSRYVLRCDEKPTFGSTICVDANFKTIQKKYSNNNSGENKKWVTKY